MREGPADPLTLGVSAAFSKVPAPVFSSPGEAVLSPRVETVPFILRER